MDITATSEDHRLMALTTWLKSHLTSAPFAIEPASVDASFRRYFRVTMDASSWIAMDAPPQQENSEPFVRVAKGMAELGLNVPQVFEKNLDEGFLLLTDFGNEPYLDRLNAQNADELYGAACQSLLHLHRSRTNPVSLPDYDEALLMQEMALFDDWLVGEHLGINLSTSDRSKLRGCFRILAQSALEQPQVWVHRDFHSRNLMVTDDRNPGVIDFQDAVIGPITYDLVSLLRDCYIAWPQQRVEGWVTRYFEQLRLHQLLDADITLNQFMRWFDLMGVQRHLKASGIFARLSHRDGKHGYLNDVPQTLAYIKQVSTHYPELDFLHRLVSQQILPRFGV